LKQLGWWVFFLVCSFYAAYALYMGLLEILSRLGLATDAPPRAAPVMFIMHALAGSVALISGPLQFNRRILTKKRIIHRLLGRIYGGAIWISSVGGLWITIFFDVSLAARIVFGLLSILWFSTTTLAYLRIRNRQVEAHQEWMIRSFSLSLFFVTFSFWTSGLTSTNLPEAIAYPLGIFLSWSLNLLFAELWILRTRAQWRRFRLRNGPDPIIN
jgi:uncharacterized membrane protein